MSTTNHPAGSRREPPLRIPFAPYRRDNRLVTSPASRAFGQNCYIVIGNHASYVGIGEMLYALGSYFGARYNLLVSITLVPNELNVIIDEFAIAAHVDYIEQMKKTHKRTRIIVLATEFVTKISLLGVALGCTFNVFDMREDRHELAHLLGYQLGLKTVAPYMYRRYCGFVRALAIADLVLCAHPAIDTTLRILPGNDIVSERPVLTLYPEIDRNRLANDERLSRLPPGIVMTGTLTSFRQSIIRKLIKAFRMAGVVTRFYQHVTFAQSPGPQFDSSEIDLGYDRIQSSDHMGSQSQDRVINYLYNLNPPQRRNWPYSSPMRILRAILLGQVPVVTQKFADHEIEAIALVWDGRRETAERMWVGATLGRFALIEQHLAAIDHYNRIAQEKNAAIDRALALIE